MLVSGEYDRQLLEPHLDAANTVTFGYAGPQSPSERGDNILLISSTTRFVSQRRDFLRASLRVIAEGLDPASYGEVVLKLHPYESRADLDPVLAEFPGLQSRLRVVRTDLHGEIAKARVAFTLLSTVILDLLNADVPFLLFDSIGWPQQTFYSQIPPELRFTSAAELAQRMALIGANYEAYRRLRALYYGAPDQTPQAILERHLF